MFQTWLRPSCPAIFPLHSDVTLSYESDIIWYQWLHPINVFIVLLLQSTNPECLQQLVSSQDSHPTHTDKSFLTWQWHNLVYFTHCSAVKSLIVRVYNNCNKKRWELVQKFPHMSLVPRPPRPAFVACSTKSRGGPGRTYHVMRAAADVMFSLLTSVLVLSPSLFFPWIQFVLSVQFVLRVRLLLDRAWLATVRDVSRGTHHVINPSRPSAFPRFSYCKRQKLGVEAWERGY